MCGIFGAFWEEKPNDFDDRLGDSINALKHRGPDDYGIETINIDDGLLALGHTRLSIIDLSSAGHQPMCSVDGRYTIVFNGEIYNYKELREQFKEYGFEFHTESDTEVLITAWSIWGQGCLNRLIGMFSFAIYDNKDKSLTLVRDAFGIKPLFYNYNGRSIFFASEESALVELANKSKVLNLQRVYDYLIYGIQDTGINTFVKDIYHVSPSHMVCFDLNNPAEYKISKWWKPSIEQTSTLTFNQAAEKLREIFLQSVKLHLRSDVPFGVALSGGIDSSALVCAIRYLEPEIPIHTFSFIAQHDAISEEPWVDLVNKHVNAIEHKISIGEDDLSGELMDLVKTQGEPFGSTSIYAQYKVFQEARKNNMTVMIEGQGADELLAGYHGYAGPRMLSLFEGRELGVMLRFAALWKKWPGRDGQSAWRSLIGQLIPSQIIYRLGLMLIGRDKTPLWFKSKAYTDAGVSFLSSRSELNDNAKRRRVMEALYSAVTEGTLPTLLRYGDRNAMRFSIENRVPFLTLPIAEYIFSLPESYLISESGETKSIFRAAMRGIVPDAVLDRKDKIGFETPMGRWLSPLKNTINALISSSDIYDKNELQTEISMAIKDQSKMTPQLWRIINLLLWGRVNKLSI